MTSPNTSDDKETFSEDENAIEEEIDFSTLTDDEKDELILEMQEEELRQQKIADKVTEVIPAKERVKKRRKKKALSKADMFPGFGRVVIRMGTAMAFSMAFILIGPILFFMALVGRVGDKMWVNALFGIIGVGLVISAWYLFKYIIKD
ncbi:MAG: hypothetical protein FK730_15635 [Asgard group archaeon]|nr:hypothetical protein [Asgard group archaeon]